MTLKANEKNHNVHHSLFFRISSRRNAKLNGMISFTKVPEMIHSYMIYVVEMVEIPKMMCPEFDCHLIVKMAAQWRGKWG